MKKIGILLVLLSTITMLFACGSKDDNTNEDTSKKNAKEETKLEVAENYLGEGGFILTNQIYDYSKICKTTYEYDSKVKLPFKQVEGTSLSYSEYGMPIIAYVDANELQAYVESLSEADFEVIKVEEEKYLAFGNNMRVTLIYYADMMELYFYIYAGNVISERNVTAQDAKKLIDASNLLEGKSAYSDYYIIEIDTESVRNNEYFEFAVFSKTQEFDPEYSLSSCYYMITDGKEIKLFEDDILCTELPTNVNMDKDNNLVVSIVKDNLLSGNAAIETYIRTYKLSDEGFEKEDEYNTNINLLEGKAVISKCENGEIKYYEIKHVEGNELGNRDKWIIDKEYER